MLTLSYLHSSFLSWIEKYLPLNSTALGWETITSNHRRWAQLLLDRRSRYLIASNVKMAFVFWRPTTEQQNATRRRQWSEGEIEIKKHKYCTHSYVCEGGLMRFGPWYSSLHRNKCFPEGIDHTCARSEDWKASLWRYGGGRLFPSDWPIACRNLSVSRHLACVLTTSCYVYTIQLDKDRLATAILGSPTKRCYYRPSEPIQSKLRQSLIPSWGELWLR
jgi:hypothetical protein